MPNMAGWADKIFQGGTKIFITIAEKFYPKIKIFGRTIFFLTHARVACICQAINGRGSLYVCLYTNLCDGNVFYNKSRWLKTNKKGSVAIQSHHSID